MDRLSEFTKRIQLTKKTLSEHEQDVVFVFSVGDIPSSSSNQSSEISKDAFGEGLLKFSRLPVQTVVRVGTEDKQDAEFNHNLRLVEMGEF